ncbi:MAG: hypothetical protein P0Y49_08710 [Candidatus Pedobacter colombiensis]|uniref:Uncharacterized protein n=1 Tax=Candidatus Pedobacter colombiensis TaxID=3121371 RepID=A0AAJ5WCP8_9SPHI|nr:hypothetical protein [Pedobacter sp.]WEK21221.1 MAG: hypothetical protein P0Y49_08710 [Pedobacter sp.]
MERRKFIILTGVGVGMSIIPASLYFMESGLKKYVTLILRRELFYLKLESEGVSRYVDDYFKATRNDMVSTLKWKILYYSNSNWKKSDRIGNLIKYYLLSSDFFINKTDESKLVNYLGLFNSYKSPVPNPYSFVLYPPNDIADPV